MVVPPLPTQRRPSQRRRLLGTLGALATMLAAGGGLVACGDDAAPQELIGYAAQPPSEVGALSLPEATNGTPFAYTAEPGKVLMAYFGYTHCPDVCPTSLTAVKSALRQVGDEIAGRVQLAFATVDPARDTPEVVDAYVKYFVPSAVALRTTDDTVLRKVADGFGVEYSVTTTAGGDVEVVHTGSIFVVDDVGTVVDVLPFPMSSEDIANDLRVLLARTSR